MTTRTITAALPQYDIGDELGSGAMGVVFAGTHKALGRSVAVKQLTLTLAGDPGMGARFEAEAKLLARLDHPHIVPIYDYVRGDGVSVLVMERLDGGTVWDRFDERGLNAAESCAIGLAMLAGLHAAHRAGVLHLDVKPKNLLFSAQGQLKVADFGIAQVVTPGATMVTSDGRVLGTPAYIAPEQALGERLTPAADIYAAGTVLYEMLTGRLPYAVDDAGNALAMIHRHVYEDPTPIAPHTDPQVPARLAAVVMRGLARDPRERFGDAEQFAIALATAATEVLGPGWLDTVDVPLHLAPRVSAATAVVPQDAVATTVLPTVRPRHDPTTRLGGLRHTNLMPADAVLRPDRTSQGHDHGGQPPDHRSPWIPLLVAACALLLTAVYPLLRHADTVPIGMTGVSVNGEPRSAPVVLEPGEAFTLSGEAPEGMNTTRLWVVMECSFVGVGMPEIEATAPIEGGRWEARMSWAGPETWLLSGAALCRVQLSPGDGTGSPYVEEFTIHTERSPLLSVIGGGSVLLILFALSYLEAVARSIRRGRRGVGLGAALAAFPGALLGVGVWVLMLSLLRYDADTVDVVIPAVLGGVAGLSLALAAGRRATNEIG